MTTMRIAVFAENGGIFCPKFERAFKRKVTDDDLDLLYRLLPKRRDLRSAFESGPWVLLDSNNQLPETTVGEPDENNTRWTDCVSPTLSLGLALRPDEFYRPIYETDPEQPLTVAYVQCVYPIEGAGTGHWELASKLDNPFIRFGLNFIQSEGGSPSGNHETSGQGPFPPIWREEMWQAPNN